MSAAAAVTVSSTVPTPAPASVAPVEAPAAPAVVPTIPDSAPAPAPAAPEPAPAPAEAGPSSYEPSGDPGLDLAASWIEGLGIKADDPMIAHALETGDFSLVKAKLASMGDKARGWEQYVALAEKGIGTLKSSYEARAAETVAIAHEVAGSPEAWNEIVKWAGENAEPAEKEQINSMFEAGGMQARAAAMLLNSLYSGAAGTVKTPESATVSTPASTQGSSGALSPDGYKQALNELVARIGTHRLDDSPEYNALRQRRAAFRG